MPLEAESTRAAPHRAYDLAGTIPTLRPLTADGGLLNELPQSSRPPGPSPPLHAQIVRARVYELLGLRIEMAPDRTLDIEGSIPTSGTIQPEEPARMISVGVPRDPYQNHPVLGFSIKADLGL